MMARGKLIFSLAQKDSVSNSFAERTRASIK